MKTLRRPILMHTRRTQDALPPFFARMGQASLVDNPITPLLGRLTVNHLHKANPHGKPRIRPRDYDDIPGTYVFRQPAPAAQATR